MTAHFVKLLSIAVAAAALVATPALARKAQTRAPAAYAQDGYAQGRYAPAPFRGSYAAADRAPGFMRGPDTVVSADGRVVGADPDPNIRQELSRDAWVSEY